ncbi:hypothetical protein L5515_017979 [Caenorhabditis briggsae]|uniref:Uncharacterized protein n=1 Tax=Caenorhabditis briggsae TaxID=6238 RepID=A0AAE9FES9_CAEBR|nr:hypothetical protein L5515_017979 [Caenorhabditis briggsae]
MFLLLKVGGTHTAAQVYRSQSTSARALGERRAPKDGWAESRSKEDELNTKWWPPPSASGKPLQSFYTSTGSRWSFDSLEVLRFSLLFEAEPAYPQHFTQCFRGNDNSKHLSSPKPTIKFSE